MLIQPHITVLIVTFVCCSFVNVAQQVKCAKQSDYADRGSARCSICVDNSGQAGHCILIQRDIYTSQPSCAKYPCLYAYQHGDCSTSEDNNDKTQYLVPYCKCFYGTLYNGSDCNKTYVKAPLLVAVRRRYYGLLVKSGEETFLHFHMLGSSDRALSNWNVYFKVGNLPSRLYYIISVKKVQGEFAGDLSPSVVFIYKVDNSTYNFETIGYNTDIYLTIYSLDILLYNNSCDIFVSYNDVIYMPAIKVLNCGKTPLRFTRSSEIKMKVTVRYNSGRGCHGEENISWNIWKIVNGRTTYEPLYAKAEVFQRKIFIEPFRFRTGTYITNVSVTNTKHKLINNANCCYFKITCQPLVVKILGGSDIMIGPKDGLYLGADKSHDPNSPPDSQSHVKSEWTCINETGNKKGVCEPKELPVSEHYFIGGNLLTPGAVYHFTLKVLWTNLYDNTGDCETCKISEKLAFLKVRIAKEPVIKYRDITVKCLGNCGKKVISNRKLYLKAVVISNNPEGIIYEWSINGHREININSIVETVPSSDLLLIKENALSMGANYTIGVKMQHSSSYGKYTFETYSIDYSVHCTVDPKLGTKGYTPFKLQCILHYDKSQSSVVVFNFFDKTDEEAELESMFSGRMLGSSLDGTLANVRLTRGKVCIYTLNEHGLFVKNVIPVTLSDWSIDYETLNALYINVTDQILYGTTSTALAAVSFIPEVITQQMAINSNDILSTLVGFVTSLTLHTFDEMQLSVSTLSNVLITMNKSNRLTLKASLMAEVFKVIKHQGVTLLQHISSGQYNLVGTKEVTMVLICLLNSVESTLGMKDNMFYNIEEKNMEPFIARQLREGSTYLDDSLDLITKILGFLQVTGHFATTIMSKNGTFVVWVLLTDRINTISDLVSKDRSIPIVLGGELCKDLKSKMNTNEEIAVYVFSSKQNVFWWSISDVRSRLVSVTMNRQISKTTSFPIRHLNKPLGIILKIDNKLNVTKIERNMHQPDPHNLDLLRLDLAIDVYRMYVQPRSVVTITFLFPPTNVSLRVFVDSRFRPDYKMMMEEAANITESSPEYRVQYLEQEEPYFLFMGVIPGPEVEVNLTAKYAFHFNTSLCKAWANGVWSSTGCHVKQVYNDQTRCECTHLSMFALAIPEPLNAFDPFGDAKLFLTVKGNPLVIGIVPSIVLLYLLLCVLCRLSERKNKMFREIIILEDNFPNDKIPYLIAVYTSARYNAGTSAHVGIRLIGGDSYSRRHILQSPRRKVLQTNYDDWFVLYCNVPLGELKTLHIWHDYSGCSPEWFCDKVFIFDLQNKTQWLFVVREWLALSANENAEALVFAVEEVSDVRSIFLHNVVLGFTEKHMILSLLASHPRDEVSRVQRISIIVCGIMVALLCNIIFYLPKDERNTMDDYNYSIETREMYVSIQTVVISTIVNCTIFILFERSYKLVNIKSNNFLRVSQGSLCSNYMPNLQGFPKEEYSLKSFYNNCVRIVKKAIETHPMTPVTLPGSQPVVEVRRFRLILAWTTCTVIIVLCSYLVMLYGFKLGLDSSKKWLSSTLIGMSGDVLIFTPLRVIFMSMLFALFFKKMYELNIHQVAVDEVVRFNISNDPEDVFKAFELRKPPMYKPMSHERGNEMVRRYENKELWWNLLDFANSIFLAIMVNNFIFQQWVSYFHLNFQNVKLITHFSNNNFGSIDFFSVNSIQSLESYLEFRFVDSLYNLWWYNGKPLNIEDNDLDMIYWSRDYTNYIFGLPVVRQFRVLPKKCNTIVLERRKCIPHWCTRHEDRNDYGERWKPLLWSDASRTSSPWKYTVKSEYFWLPLYKIYSPSGNPYNSGGYMQLLGLTRKPTILKLAELNQNSWLDARTRAVFVEMTSYNVNLNVLTHVTLIIEYTITGNVLLLARAATVNSKMPLTGWSAMFLIIMFYYLFRSFQLINREGPKVFFSSCRNVLRVTIVILIIASLTLLFIDDCLSSKYLKEFERNGVDRYFDFHYFVKYTVLLRHVLGLLLRIAFVLMVILLQSGGNVVNQVYLFRCSCLQTFWTTVMLVVIITALVKLATLASLPFTLKSILIVKQPLQLIQTEDLERLDIKIFLITKTVVFTMCLWCYVITFTWYITMARTGLAKSPHFSYTSFYKNMFVKPNK